MVTLMIVTIINNNIDDSNHNNIDDSNHNNIDDSNHGNIDDPGNTCPLGNELLPVLPGSCQ